MDTNLGVDETDGATFDNPGLEPLNKVFVNPEFVGTLLAVTGFVGATPDSPVLIIVGVGTAGISFTANVLELNVDFGTAKVVVCGTLGLSKSAVRPVYPGPVAI